MRAILPLLPSAPPHKQSFHSKLGHEIRNSDVPGLLSVIQTWLFKISGLFLVTLLALISNEDYVLVSQYFLSFPCSTVNWWMEIRPVVWGCGTLCKGKADLTLKTAFSALLLKYCITQMNMMLDLCEQTHSDQGLSKVLRCDVRKYQYTWVLQYFVSQKLYILCCVEIPATLNSDFMQVKCHLAYHNILQ